jgi:hypothetical protein
MIAFKFSTKEIRQMQQVATAKVSSIKEDIPISARKITGFPVKRRPKLRKLSEADEEKVEEWFIESGIVIGNMAEITEQIANAKRLLHTWKDCFAATMREIKPTDLVYHAIDLKPDSKPVYKRVLRYTVKEREFAARIFPEMEEAGILVRGASEWGARSKFSFKKKGSDQLRVVHNFIPLNDCTMKPQYPGHRIEKVIDTIVKPKFGVFFSSDASNEYWAVPVRPGDEHKCAIVTPHGQYLYLRMEQGLKGAAATYTQFGDLVFEPLPKTDEVPAMPSLIGEQSNGQKAFSLFMNDHCESATSFDFMFIFLHEKYFPRVAFGPVYLSGSKTFVFSDSLKMVGFTDGAGGLRPFIKHREKILNWPEPANREELNVII